MKMITIDKAIDILRGMRAKTRKPAEKKMLPQYMQNWDDRKIDEYYEKQKFMVMLLTLLFVVCKT